MILTTRALNRALLARQHLLGRVSLPPAALLEHLVGMQAQAPQAPYVAMWSRCEAFDPETLSSLIRDRRAVRLALMRSTLHLVTAEDVHALRRLLEPVQIRALYQGSPFGRRLAGLDVAALVAAGRSFVEAAPCTNAELAALLAARFPGGDPEAMAQAIRNLTPLVQVPPRGLWGQSGASRCTTAEAWLGRPIGAGISVQRMVLRYLAAFGPASVQDTQTWSGLTGLAEVYGALRPQLLMFRDAGGRELFDVPEAPRPPEDTPAPVRFLPDYDNVTLSHQDRARIVSEEVRKHVATPNSIGMATFLVDGWVAGTWRRVGRRIEVRPVVPIVDPEAVRAEAGRLAGFLGAGDVAFALGTN